MFCLVCLLSLLLHLCLFLVDMGFFYFYSFCVCVCVFVCFQAVLNTTSVVTPVVEHWMKYMIQPEGTNLWISQQHLSVTSHQSVWCLKQETVIGNQMDFKLGLPQFRIFCIIFVLLIYMLFNKSKNKYYCLKAYYYMDDFYLITFMELWNQGQSNLQTMSTPREVPSTTCT